MAGVYVHLPFCPYVCPYCDFAKWPHRRSAALRYLSALEAEIAAAPAFAAKTLFLGGGTPNVYPAADIARLVARLRTRFSLGSAAEVTIELNPDLSLCEEFGAYVEAGINRFSFGVQSFVDAELAALGRQHRGGEVVAAVDRARIAGVSNLSVDLMFGIPGQTVDSWKGSLAAALELEPHHVSTYGLTIEAGTPSRRRASNTTRSATLRDRASARTITRTIGRTDPTLVWELERRAISTALARYTPGQSTRTATRRSAGARSPVPRNTSRGRRASARRRCWRCARARG